MLEDNPQSKGEKLLKQFSNYGYKPTNSRWRILVVLKFQNKLFIKKEPDQGSFLFALGDSAEENLPLRPIF